VSLANRQVVETQQSGRSRCSIKMRLLSKPSRLRLVLVSLVLVSCAAAAPAVDSAISRPPEGPCELDAESLRRIGQLDAEFQHSRQVPETEPTSDDGYGYEFDDDPLGATVDDGSCDCLARAVSNGHARTCVGVLRAASLCLGGPGSERLWSHRNCLPHRATATSNTTIDLAQNGCTVPDSLFLVVSGGGTTSSASR
jgi:hypothetical protein